MARTLARRLLVPTTLFAMVATFQFTGAAQAATPTADATSPSCDTVMGASTPMAGAHSSMAGTEMGSPMAGMAAEFDQLYIDMMIPHHASIIALAQAALPRLTDERLVTIAEAVIASQGPEIEELRGYREQWYGNPEPMPMDEAMMGMMMQEMPSMTGSMDEMAMQMDPDAQVAAFCAAADPDLAFIDLTIPHHQSAIAASQDALAAATHQEIKDFAQRVIDAQQREIDELTAVRAELTGAATPVP